MIYIEKNDIHCTLTTYIYCHMWMLWSFEQRGINDVYISWPEGKSVKSYEDKSWFNVWANQFEWYFNQPKGCHDYCTKADETFTWEHWIDPCPVSFMSQPLSVIKDYYKKNLHFNEETNKRGQAIVDRYNIDFSKTIGVTWRGTDIYLDGRIRIPVERYYKHIDKFIEETPDARIACTSEEKTILDPLFKRYGERALLIEEFYQAPFESKHNPERFSPMSGYERGLIPVLMVWLFSKCKYYIKNRSSTGAVASWLSDGFIVNLGHPETLGYENQFDKDEIKGIWYDV